VQGVTHALAAPQHSFGCLRLQRSARSRARRPYRRARCAGDCWRGHSALRSRSSCTRASIASSPSPSGAPCTRGRERPFAPPARRREGPRWPSTAGSRPTSSNAFRSATANAAISRRRSHPTRLVEELNHGHRLHPHHLRVLPAHLGLRSPLREGLAVTSLLIVGGVLAALLLAYLGFALLFPEKLS
jgi:K+-transporting ATPase KdpF subunit